MDIQIFGNETLRIKSKKTTLAVDPKSTVSKFDADATVVMDKNSDPSRVNNSRVVLEGAGEFEISGLKISGIDSDNGIMYGLTFENTSILVAKASSLEKISVDKLGEFQIAVINVDSNLNQSVVTAMEPRVVILYGEKKKEGAKILGKENVSSLAKITVSEDKLPEELDIMLLG